MLCFAGLKVSPYRRKASEIFYNFTYGLYNVVHLLFGDVFTKTESERSVSHVVDASDSQQYVAGIQ